MYTELTEDNLQGLVKDSQKVIVQYGAAWCGNCKLTKPKFKRMAEENQDVLFVYVDAENYPASRQLADVNNLPTFAAFLNGTLVSQKQGSKLEVIQEVYHAIAGH